MGGLEKFLPVWENEARSANLDTSLIQSVTEKIQTYRDLDTDGRAALILDLGRQLRSAQPAQAAKAAERLALPARKDPGLPSPAAMRNGLEPAGSGG